MQGYGYWAFSDIFEENYFPSVAFHGGFGLLTLHGIPKPTYRAFELLHRLGTELLPATGGHDTVDAWFVRAGDAVTALLTNHARPHDPVATEVVVLRVATPTRPLAVRVERIDDDHANPVRLWHSMGDPVYLRSAQVDALRAVSALVAEPLPWQYADGVVEVTIALPPHAVAAVTVDLFPAAAP